MSLSIQAVQEAKRRQEREQLLQKLDVKSSESKNQDNSTSLQHSSVVPPDIRMMLSDIEQAANEQYKMQLEELKSYEDGLRTILDIRCSLFKSRELREQVEDSLIKGLADNKLGDVVSYNDLKTVYKYDGSYFCGKNADENGKLRPLLVRNWKLQVELNKYRNIVDSLKESLP